MSMQDLAVLGKLLLDILVVWALIYSGLRIIRNNSRTIQIFKGILVILLIKIVAVFLGLKALSALIDTFLNWGVVAVLILFSQRSDRCLKSRENNDDLQQQRDRRRICAYDQSACRSVHGDVENKNRSLDHDPAIAIA